MLFFLQLSKIRLSLLKLTDLFLHENLRNYSLDEE